MSISTVIAVRLTRIAQYFAKSVRQKLQRQFAASNQAFTRIHEEKRAAIAEAELNRQFLIEAANKQRTRLEEEAKKIAAKQELQVADRASRIQADLYELEKGCGLK